MKDLFRTIAAPARGIYKEKGSKFLAFAYPVWSEEDIKEHLDQLRKEYHDARHHCYAWCLGPDMEHYRINDDGEPSGSAGKPIYGQLQKFELSNILVVVVRYFGGTLLGVSGLIRAYRSATADAIEQARIIAQRVEEDIRVEFPYASMNPVMKAIKEFKLEFTDQQFDTDCTLQLRVWKRQLPSLSNRLSKLEGCKILYL